MLSAANAAFIAAPGDEDAYVAALAALIDDASLRERLGRANLARSDAFGESAMIEAFRALYMRAAGRAP
jgi:glycosyltransferase involved in cell wall biosynthesis